MQNELISTLGKVRVALAWAPDWSVGVVLIALAAVLAIAVHAVVLSILRRTISQQRVFVRLLIERSRGPMLMALLIFFIGSALQTTPFPPQLVAALTHLLLAAFIVLLGWVALTAVDLAATLYLRQFRIDVEDNLLARKHTTQVRILRRALSVMVILFTAGGVLMTFEGVRQYGVSIFASAGIAGIVLGFAAQRVLSNLFAGIQIAMTQPIRIDDVVIVEGEWGWIEEITSTFVVVRIWDLRRLVVPLNYFIEQPFQNWTRETAALLAPVVLFLDYTVPLAALRKKVDEIAEHSKLWDGKVKSVQVVDAREQTIEVRALLSARNSGDAWNLRCEVREKLITFLQEEYPHALPRQRTEIEMKSPLALEDAGQVTGSRPKAG